MVAQAALAASDFLVFPNGNIGSLRGDTNGEERRLDGSLVRTVVPVGATTDQHELMPLPNGNYLITTLRRLAAAATAVTRTSRSWTTAPRKSNPTARLCGRGGLRITSHCLRFRASGAIQPIPAGVLDPFHINSLEPEGNDVLMSFRHLDAVYSVHKIDGSVDWKLGGTARPQSLTVLNDPVVDRLRRFPWAARRPRSQ